MPFADLETRRRYQRKWTAARRQQWFDENGPCVRCGTWDDLELDHRDPAKKVDHRVWNWSDARRLRELAKCQALCADCHRDKTYEDRGGLKPCGTRAAYDRGCRCRPCKDANNAKVAAYKRRRSA